MLRAWKRKGKGKGLRWQILREILAISSRFPLSTSHLQDCMTILRGMNRSTTWTMIQELEEAELMESGKSEKGPYWTITERGIDLFQIKRKAIPVGIVKVGLTITNA